MAYSVVADVQRKTGKTYSDSPATIPTETQVTTAIAEGDGLIDQVLEGAGFSPPIDSTDSPKAYKVLTAISVLYAASEAEDAGGSLDRSERFMRQFDRRLKMLGNGEIPLTDATKGGDEPETPSGRVPSGSFNKDSNGDERDSKVTRTTKF
jgi:hypothetical protein